MADTLEALILARKALQDVLSYTRTCDFLPGAAEAVRVIDEVLIENTRRAANAEKTTGEPIAQALVGLPDILREAAAILNGEREMRFPIVDELEGFASMIAAAPQVSPVQAIDERTVRNAEKVGDQG